MRGWIAGLVLVGCAGGGAEPPVAKPPPVARPATPPPMPAPAPAPPAPWDGLNLGFEQVSGDVPAGWTQHSSYQWRTVSDVKHGSEHSLELRSAGKDEFGAAILSVPAEPVRGKHLKLRGWIRTDGVKGSAAMFLRVDGGGGAFDNMGDRGITGTTDWTAVSVEVDVPEQGEKVVFGPMLIGAGAAWFDDLRFEVSESAKPQPIVVEGIVVSAAGTPVAGADVALVKPEGIQLHVRADAEGKFRFETRSGKLGFSAHHADHVGSFVNGKQLDGDAKVTLTLGTGGGVVVHGKLGPAKPAPNAYVAVSLFSSDDADVFAVPVAADGTFTATLPRGEQYRASVIDGPAASVSARRVGDRVELALVAPVLGPPPQAVVDWIGARAIALRTAEAGQGLDDLAPIGKLVGKARVVALGEATHGTREFFQLKHRVLEYLVAKQGFTVFAIEANQPECRAINDYVLRGVGDPRAGLNGIYFWTWNTEEVLAMIEWMRAWNADPRHRNKVQFLGFDMQTSKFAHASVAAYLAKVAPDAAPGLLAPIEALASSGSSTAIGKMTADQRKVVTDGLAAIAKAFDGQRKAWAQKTSAAELDEMRHDLTILEQATAMYAPATGTTPFHVRDKAMADNVGWILAQQPGARIVVWAHNGHIANRLEAFENMGSHLRKQLKTGYLNVGFVFSQGSFQAMQRTNGGGGLNEITLGAPPESDVSVAFARTGKPLLVLDLRALPRTGVVRDWFWSPHPMRETGAVFSTEQNMTNTVVLPELYDAMIFVDKTTRARPNRRN
jgi:erythromycin esterase